MTWPPWVRPPRGRAEPSDGTRPASPVEEYRAAHAIAERHASGGVETEDLRQAMVHYRALFIDLLDTDTRETEAQTEKERELTSGGVR